MKQLFIFGAALFLCACSDNSEIIPSGKLVKQNRPVSSFSVINVSNGIHLTLSQEDKDVAVNVEADDNIIQYIETFTENHILYLRLKDGINIREDRTINMSVSVASLDSLFSSGGSQISFSTPFESDRLFIQASGGPEISGVVHIDDFACNVSGGGKISFSGISDQFELQTSGGSESKLYDLEIRVAQIEVSGGSLVELNVQDTLSVHATGGSKIYYQGDDALVMDPYLDGGSTITKR